MTVAKKRAVKASSSPVEDRSGTLWYRRAWFLLLAAFAALELWAIKVRRETGDTFSEYVWVKIGTLWMRGAVGGLLLWLLYHFLFSGPREMGRKDLFAALLGIALGIGSYYLRKGAS